MASFPRNNRLIRPSEFQRVFRLSKASRKRVFIQGLGVRVCEGAEAQARLGLAISKKTFKRAVDRNRVKRLVRESFRHHLPDLPPVDVVILSHKELAGMDNAAIFQQLENLWRRVRKLYAVSAQ